ncbi:hypothetical protein D3C86_1916490 [compost metagenome]
MALDHAIDQGPYLIGDAHVAGDELGCPSIVRRQGLGRVATADDDATSRLQQSL